MVRGGVPYVEGWKLKTCVVLEPAGVDYVQDYLGHFGDLCSEVVSRLIKERRCTVLAVGPDGVDSEGLVELAIGGGGFGVSEAVDQYVESKVRDYLEQGPQRLAVFELLLGPESGASRALAFPAFRFSPSRYGTSDGQSWTDWSQGWCGYQTSLGRDAGVLKQLLAESRWAKGIIFLLPATDRAKVKLEAREAWDAESLEELFFGIEVVIVPAHNREAIALWQAG